MPPASSLGTWQSRPIYLRDVATLTDGPAEPADYVLFGRPDGTGEEAAVTLSVAKRPAPTPSTVVQRSAPGRPPARRAPARRCRGHLHPRLRPHRREKSNELLLHMGIAVFGVALLILFFLGWRESLVVLLAIPTTLA
jgi:multidrug efflux pump subunit AcrB